MMTIRRSRDRGHFNYGWLDTHHTFSFAGYFDPAQMGFRSLRVINEDWIRPGKGFPMHPHQDMEIVTYVLEGALEHRDSMGNGGVIRPGDVQRMSAGTGLRHSEYNSSSSEDVHLLQIWIEPDAFGFPPSYEQRSFPAWGRRGSWRLVASPDGRDGSITYHTGTDLYAATLEPDEEIAHVLRGGRHAWVQVARGSVEIAGELLLAGDGAAVSAQEVVRIEATDTSELLLFDLA